MKRMTTEQLIGLHTRGEGLQAPMLSLWDELAEYIHPAKVGFTGPKTDGEKRTTKLWDSTGPQANDDLAHYLAAALTPAFSPWLDITFRSEDLASSDAFKEWLEACAEIQRKELSRCNFYEAMGEVYSDLPSFGVGTLQCDERKDRLGKFDGLNFESVWLRELVLLPDEYGDLTLSFRAYEMSAMQWVSMFGAEVGPKVQEIANTKPESKVKFLHAVYPRDLEDIDVKGIEAGAADPKKMPFASVWINLVDKLTVRESGYLEMPRYTARWARTSGSIWANCPGLMALPDIRTINEAKRLELNAWEKSIDRPMKTGLNNIQGKLDMGAGGLTTCRDPNALMPLYDGTDFNLTAVKVEDLRASILRTFFADLIREPSDVRSGTTAYEVAKRLERAQRILGESVGHLRRLLRWAVERSFMILYRNGAFPPMPPGLMEAKGKLDVRYTSPLQVAQQSQGIEQTLLFLGDLSQAAQFNPEVFDWVDWDGWTLDAAKRRSVPAVALRDQAAVDEIRDERKARQEQERQAGLAVAGGQVVRDVGAGAGPQAAGALMGQGAA
jgi:hypothetical protein